MDIYQANIYVHINEMCIFWILATLSTLNLYLHLLQVAPDWPLPLVSYFKVDRNETKWKWSFINLNAADNKDRYDNFPGTRELC